MNQQLIDLHLRRGRLLERITTQRIIFGQQTQPLQTTLAATDRVLAGVQAGIYYIKTHPGVAALAVAVLFIAKPVRTWRWSARAFSVWQTWRLMRDRFDIP